MPEPPADRPSLLARTPLCSLAAARSLTAAVLPASKPSPCSAPFRKVNLLRVLDTPDSRPGAPATSCAANRTACSQVLLPTSPALRVSPAARRHQYTECRRSTP